LLIRNLFVFVVVIISSSSSSSYYYYYYYYYRILSFPLPHNLLIWPTTSPMDGMAVEYTPPPKKNPLSSPACKRHISQNEDVHNVTAANTIKSVKIVLFLVVLFTFFGGWPLHSVPEKMMKGGGTTSGR